MIRKALVQASGQMEQIPDGDFLNIGKLNLGSPETITAANTISVSKSYVVLKHLGGGTQNVDQINGGDIGDVIVIRRAVAGNNVRIRKDVGNITGSSNRLLNNPRDVVILLLTEFNIWLEISWNNG